MENISSEHNFNMFDNFNIQKYLKSCTFQVELLHSVTRAGLKTSMNKSRLNNWNSNSLMAI